MVRLFTRDETATAAENGDVVWTGPDALRPHLVPISALEPFPGNPRRGSVADLRASLRRFGQTLPALADPTLADGDRLRIVARHHVIEAAREEGWTHVAVVPHEFASEGEARAFLLADNRTADLGGYDDELLSLHLRALADDPVGLDGTGYDEEAVAEVLARLAAAAAEPVIERDGGQREHRDPTLKELVLTYNPERFAQVEQWLGIVAKERGTSGTSETAYEALRLAALHLNQK